MDERTWQLVQAMRSGETTIDNLRNELDAILHEPLFTEEEDARFHALNTAICLAPVGQQNKQQS